MLLEANVDKDTATERGATAMFVACLNGSTAIVRMLLEARADTEKTSRRGATPMYAASQKGHTEIVRLLLEARADKNKATRQGATPFSAAQVNGNKELAQLLQEGCIPCRPTETAEQSKRSVRALILLPICQGRGENREPQRHPDLEKNNPGCNMQSCHCQEPPSYPLARGGIGILQLQVGIAVETFTHASVVGFTGTPSRKEPPKQWIMKASIIGAALRFRDLLDTPTLRRRVGKSKSQAQLEHVDIL